jgi:hypothetical protein
MTRLFFHWLSLLPIVASIPVEHRETVGRAFATAEKNFNAPARFRLYEPMENAAVYQITLCADLPDNQNPDRLHVKDETGHVFLILSKIIPQKDTIHQVFGFYPVRPASTLLFKNVEAELLDNGGREYDASVYRQVRAEQFANILQFCLSHKNTYNLNKYNCYDFALEAFNNVEGQQKIPNKHVRFPLLLGYGGSPCGLYKDLLQLKTENTPLSKNIQITTRRAPFSKQ